MLFAGNATSRRNGWGASGGPGTGTVGYHPYWETATKLSATGQLYRQAANFLKFLFAGADFILFQLEHGTANQNVEIRLKNVPNNKLLQIALIPFGTVYGLISADGELRLEGADSVDVRSYGGYVRLREGTTLNRFVVDATGYKWESDAAVEYAKMTFLGELSLKTGVFWGAPAVDGTYRIALASGEVAVQKRVGGVYVSDVYTVGAVAAGTTYDLTAAYALVDFGTTDPSIVIARAGTYIITVHTILATACTISVGGNVELKIRRTNNAPADIAENIFPLSAMAYIGHEGYGIGIRQFAYTTANTDDILELWGRFTGTITVGAITVLSCSVLAVRLR